MRRRLMFGGGLTVCWLCWVWAAQGQFAGNEAGGTPRAAAGQYPCWRTVTAAEVNVRSGGSDKFLATGSLRRGDRVVVLGESAKFKGWLEIKPPLGSFSWVNAKYVRRKGAYTAIVEAADGGDVPIQPGQLGDKSIARQEHMRLKPGHLLVLLDDIPVTHDKEQWLPVGVVPGEVRYLPAEAVEGSGYEPLPQLADDSGADPRGLRGGGVPGSNQQPGNPVQFASQKTVYYSPQSVATGPQPAHTSYRPANKQWSRWGVLRRTNSVSAGQPMYALESGGQVTTYAVTAPELTLEPYVGRTVCLYGSPGQTANTVPPVNVLTVNYVALP